MDKKLFICLLLFLSPFYVFSKTITLVTLQYPPFEYKENGISKGINVDIVKEALKRMGHDAKIKFFPWKRALLMAQNGYADGLIDAAYDENRAKYMHFPNTEINIEQWFAFKKKNSKLTLDKNLANSKDITLGITRGFVYGGIIQKLIDKNMFKSTQLVSNNELNITKLIANRFDMFIGVKEVTLYLSKRLNYRDDIEIVKMTNTNKDYLLNSSKTYLAFSKKTISKEFSDQFSKVLMQMKNDGTIEKIKNSHL